MASSRKLFAVVVGLLAAADLAWSADTAWSADLAPPPVAPVPFSWSGIYVGLNAGYAGATLNETVSDGSGSGSAAIPGGIGGAQFGFNYQWGSLVTGLEADFDGTMATKSISAGTASGTAQIPWIGTLRARLGYAFDRWLIYATAGGAATQLVANVNAGDLGSASTTFTHGGWAAGGGLEAAVTNNLSVRLEYLYVDTGNFAAAYVGAAPPPPSVTVTGRLQENLVRAGLNYRLPIAW